MSLSGSAAGAGASSGSAGNASGAGIREGELSDRRERMRAAALRRAEAASTSNGGTNMKSA